MGTLKTWRSRGTIPSPYESDFYDASDKVSASEIARIQMIADIDAINLTGFAIAPAFYGRRSGMVIFAAQFENFQLEVKELRKILFQFMRNPSQSNAEGIYAHDKIVSRHLFSERIGRRLRQQTDLSKQLTVSEMDECRSAVARLYRQLE